MNKGRADHTQHLLGGFEKRHLLKPPLDLGPFVLQAFPKPFGILLEGLMQQHEQQQIAVAAFAGMLRQRLQQIDFIGTVMPCFKFEKFPQFINHQIDALALFVCQRGLQGRYLCQ